MKTFSIQLFLVIGTIIFLIFQTSCKETKQENDTKESKEIQTGKFADEIDSLNHVIRENPRNHELFVKRAKIQFEKANVEEAITDMQIALVIDSLNTDYYVQLAEYFLVVGHSGHARDALLKALSIDPMDADARVKLAQIYFYVEMYREAMREILNLEENNLHSAESFFIKGLILYETNSMSEAIRAFRNTVEYDRNHWQAYNFLGLIYARKQDPLAVEYFNTATRLFPDNLEIRLNAGITYQEFEMPEKAIEQYQYIISKDSSIYNAFFNKAYVYTELLNDYENAIKYYTKAIELDNESYPAYYNRGLAYELSGNLSAAEKDYRKALEIRPNYDLAVQGLNEVIDKQRSQN